VATEGFEGFYVETTNYGATGAFWESLGFVNSFETDHHSGQWEHPKGGPWVFIAERPGPEVETYPIFRVADAAAFAPSRPLEYARAFEPMHWDVLEALVRDPDGRTVALQAPLPEGVTAPDADAHHAEKYGTH
jgi:hypothetical protein